MIPIRLFGKKYSVDSEKNGSLKVIEGNDLVTDPLDVEPVYQYLANSAASTQMAITTGTLAAPVVFSVKAHQTAHRFITHLYFKIQGAVGVLNEFGTGTALTNGVQIWAKNSKSTKQVGFNFTSNFQMKELCLLSPAHGVSTDFGRIDNAIGTDELYAGILDLRLFYGKDGFLIKPGSDGDISVYIRDNTLTGRASNFQCQAIGRDVFYE